MSTAWPFAVSPEVAIEYVSAAGTLGSVSEDELVCMSTMVWLVCQ